MHSVCLLHLINVKITCLFTDKLHRTSYFLIKEAMNLFNFTANSVFYVFYFFWVLCFMI